MSESPDKEASQPRFLPREGFQSLLDSLQHAGYRCVGPQVKEGAIATLRSSRSMICRTVSMISSLPANTVLSTAEQRCFAWANGPQALKPLLFAPRENLWRAERDDDGRIQFRETLPAVTAVAVIGVRACDLAALRIQDKIFLQDNYADPYYAARREGLFLVAVNCTHPAATCFCVSTGDGPGATHGYDIALDELDEGFVAVSGSPAGDAVLDGLALAPAGDEQRRAVEAQVSACGADADAHATRS